MTTYLVHEWIEGIGGSEKVLRALADLYPDAEIRCLWDADRQWFSDRIVNESWIARTPLRGHKGLALPLMPAAWRAVQFKDPSRIIVSSHLFAHHVATKFPDVPTYVYTHTPARYIWEPELDQRLPEVRGGARLLDLLQRYDRRQVRRGNANFAANSEFVARRMARCWDVDAHVIYPPVSVERISSTAAWADALDAVEQSVLDSLPEYFVLGASRFVPYKSLDIVIRVAADAGVPVVIAGQGPERDRLGAVAAERRAHCHFVESPTDTLLYALYQRAAAFVFPPIEDFGIMPVEAMAAGAPVIVSNEGGASESVVNGVTGIHVEEWTANALLDALSQVERMCPEESRNRARAFSLEAFNAEVGKWITPQ